MSSAVALLRHRPRFRALWAALAHSYSGSGAAVTALTLYVQQTHGTGTAGGALVTLFAAPTLLRAPTPGAVDLR